MASVVHRGLEGIIYRAPETLNIPNLDVLSLIFDSEFTGAQREDAPVHADAADPTRCVTKSQLRTLVKRTAHTFRTNYGIGKNGPNKDVVLCISTGHYLLPNVFYSTIAAGGIFSSSGSGSTPIELAGQIEQVDARLLVCSADVKDVALAAAESAGLPLDRVVIFGHGDGLSLTQAVTGARVSLSSRLLDWPRITDPVALASSTICLIFSSGTTGTPKSVQLSHANMVAQSHVTISLSRAYLEREKPGLQFRTLAHLPASHIAGIQSYCVNAVYHGGVVYWMPRFDLAGFLEYNKRHQITNLVSVPPIYLLIAKSPLVVDQFDNLDHAITAAAPMGKELQGAAMAKLGKGRPALAQTWGLSETSGSVTHMPRGMTDDTGSVGVLISNHEMRIVDDAGKDVEPGHRGEFLVRGPIVTKGYHKNEQASKEAFVNGWFCTGDIGYFKNGMFYIVDRKKELIKYKGYQVAPAELEAVLVSHPKILDAAVIGIEGDGTELPRAYIVADKTKITKEDIFKWLNGQVAAYKRLRGGVVFIDVIPKSPSGKILRKILREMVRKETQSKL